MGHWTRRALAGLLIAAALPAAAAEWPTKPVTIIVPFAAGGTTDILARAVAERLTPALGQTVLVVNQGGAGGNIGAGAVARAAPDGHTLMMSSVGPSAMNQFLYAKMPYDTATAFAPIVNVATIPNVLVVAPKLPAATVAEFVALSKARPGGLNFGSPSPGTTGHLTSELIKRVAGIEGTHVPYKGSGPMLADLIGGNIDFAVDNLPASIGFIRSNSIRALAVTGPTRSSELPDVPTLAEAGLPGIAVTSWFCLVAPAGTPAEVVTRVNSEVNKALGSPEMRQRLATLGATPAGGSPEDLAKLLADEAVKWKGVIEGANVKLD